MKILLFDAILERHTCESLARALGARGHEVEWTGPLWKGHRFPSEKADLERIWDAVARAEGARPDVVLNFRASTLLPEMVARLRASGIQCMVWFPDDPVLYEVCYRHVVDAYDMVLHCGSLRVLDFYTQRHGCTGVNFPFWTDEVAYPYGYDPEEADLDIVFLGQCNGPVRSGRYELVRGLPFRTRIFGSADQDPANIVEGWLEGPGAIGPALARGRLGLNIPQAFSSYRGLDYDYPELASLGSFQFPSRVIQYAAVGLPVLTLSDEPGNGYLPEEIRATNPDDLVARASALLGAPGGLRDISAKTRLRFLERFSAQSRSIFLERLVASPEIWKNARALVREGIFSEFPANLSTA